MDPLDAIRADIVIAIGNLEEAITALMPGQAPSSTGTEIMDAIVAAEVELAKVSDKLSELRGRLPKDFGDR